MGTPGGRLDRCGAIDGRGAADRGSALVEFTFLGVLVLIPLLYVLLTVFEVQRSAFALTGAAREAGRAFVLAPSSNHAAMRADVAVAIAAQDQGLDPREVELVVDCAADPCLTPGATVTLRLTTRVPLPWIPEFTGGPSGVRVSTEHVAMVDRFRQVRP